MNFSHLVWLWDWPKRKFSPIIHWGLVMPCDIEILDNIGLGNGLSHIQCHAITQTNADSDLAPIRCLVTNLSNSNQTTIFFQTLKRKCHLQNVGQFVLAFVSYYGRANHPCSWSYQASILHMPYKSNMCIILAWLGHSTAVQKQKDRHNSIFNITCHTRSCQHSTLNL